MSDTKKEARRILDNMCSMGALNSLIAVLCDPAGKCSIHGSDEDRRIIDESLLALTATLAAPQPVQEPFNVQPRCCFHDSDCAVHNMPHSPAGPCDCTQKDAGFWSVTGNMSRIVFCPHELQAFADLVRQHEMERCIEIAERNYNGENIAKAIRERTTT
jgi:hypothetical protein